MKCAKVGECGIFWGFFFSYCVCVYVQVSHQPSGLFRQQPPNFIVGFTLFIFVYARRKKGGDCKTAFRATSYTKNDVLVSSSQVGSSGFPSSVRRHSIALSFRIHPLFIQRNIFIQQEEQGNGTNDADCKTGKYDRFAVFFQDTNFNVVALKKKKVSGLKFSWNLLPCEPQTRSSDPSQALMDI